MTESDDEIKKTVLDFLKQHKLAVISSIKEEKGVFKPSSAIVAVKFFDNFSCIILTSDISQKVKNIKQNNNIALSVGGSENEPYTVEYEGMGKIVEYGEKYSLLLKHFVVYPQGIRAYLEADTPVIIEIRPRNMRFTEVDVNPPTVCELVCDDVDKIVA